uniref:DNA polymerase V n=1 Tax=Kalanchoe fedtschenkoi TaxID=63787 RepID=A0A7N0TMV7_KALFE
MAGSKRSSDAATELSAGAAEADKQAKKLKRSGKKKGEAEKGEGAAKSVTSMERRKKRKELDKLKHRSEDGAAVAKRIFNDANEGVVEAADGSAPQLHIRVFKDLAAADGGVREAAAEQLVNELVEIQKAYEEGGGVEPGQNGSILEAQKDDGLDSCAPSVRYAVRRLIRGVSSSRECARQGFALGLAVVVRSVTKIDIGALLKLIVSLLEVTSSMKGQEARDCYLGRLFAYGAIAGSGRLVQEWNNDNDTPYIKEFVVTVVSLAGKKQYLQEPSAKVILELANKLPVQAVVDHVVEAERLREWFDGAPEAGNPDALLLALKLRERIDVDSQAFGRLLPHPFSSAALFSGSHLPALVHCLKESTFCQPRVHSVWPVLMNTLIPDGLLQDGCGALVNSAKKHKKSRKAASPEDDLTKSIHSFFEVVIEGSLLQSSHDRKHLALDVVLLLLKRAPAASIPVVLSYKLVQCLTDVLSTKDTWLHKVALHFLKELGNCVASDDEKRVAIIIALQKHSGGRFDSTTRTHTVKDLMAGFQTEAGYDVFSENLKKLFLDEEQSSEEPSDQSQTTDDNSEIGSVEGKDSDGIYGNGDALKSWVIESLPSVIKHLKLDPDARFRVQQDVMKFLAVQGLFSASLGTEVTSFDLQEKFRWPKIATSIALCRMCIEQLQSLFAYTQKSESLVTPASLEHSDLPSYFMHFLATLRGIPSVSLFRNLDDEEEQVLKDIQATMAKLFKKEREIVFDSATDPDLKPKADRLHAMRYVLIQMVLQEFLQPDQYLEPAGELVICCEKELLLKDDETPEFTDVLVDTLLSLLPQSSASMRFTIEQVFKYFCIDVNSATLLRMLRVIKEGLTRRRVQNAEDDEDEDDDLFDLEEAEEGDEAESDDNENDEAESDGQTDDSEPAGEPAVAAKEQAEDSEDDSDEGMDDDQMFNMDKYLVQIFREKRNQAGGGDSTQAQLNLFKLRVLSLLEIFLQQNTERPEVLTVYSHLAQAFVHPQIAEGNQQLGQRIWSILQKRILKAKNGPGPKDCELDTLEPLLERNLKLASKPFKKKKSAANPSKKKQSASWNRHKMITSLARDSTFWILKLIDGRNLPEDKLQKVFEIFQNTLVEYFDSKKCQLKSDFLKEIFRRRPWVGHHVFGFLLEKCSGAKSEFRRVEALDLVTEVLKSLVSSNSEKENTDSSKKILKRHLSKISHLIAELIANMPEKQSRRADVRKFCTKVFQMVSAHSLNKPFLKELTQEAQNAIESQLGDSFLSLKKEGYTRTE